MCFPSNCPLQIIIYLSDHKLSFLCGSQDARCYNSSGPSGQDPRASPLSEVFPLLTVSTYSCCFNFNSVWTSSDDTFLHRSKFIMPSACLMRKFTESQTEVSILRDQPPPSQKKGTQPKTMTPPFLVSRLSNEPIPHPTSNPPLPKPYLTNSSLPAPSHSALSTPARLYTQECIFVCLFLLDKMLPSNPDCL